ncbi:MAG: hypothetical protein Q9M50_05060 [Methylococcales bacterium]|nr:hypothetical protein [Methylococcales bacterium]
MKKKTSTGLLISLVYFLLLTPLSANSLSGNIEAPARVKKLIIYLTHESSIQKNKTPIVHHVSQKNTRFSEPLLIVRSGDTIEWLNNEAKEIDHNIFSLSPLNRFDLGLGVKGSTLSHVFKKTGVLNYYCSVHKEMEGKIVILPSRHYQLLTQPGHFKIDNIPEGQWTLKVIVFHRRYQVKTMQITVVNNQPNTVNLKVIKR